jgi:hypothetical protein
MFLKNVSNSTAKTLAEQDDDVVREEMALGGSDQHRNIWSAGSSAKASERAVGWAGMGVGCSTWVIRLAEGNSSDYEGKR